MRLQGKRMWILLGLGLMVWAFSACRPVPAGETLPLSPPSTTTDTGVLATRVASPTPAAPETQTPSPCPSPTLTQEGWSVVPAKARPAVNSARADLASRLEIGEDRIEDQIRMNLIETVEWRDSSLGCPELGKVYLQVITPGYRIVLRAGGKLYEYHAAQGQDRAILCEGGVPVK